MSHLTYQIVEHDGGWAYMVNGAYSESYPSHAQALTAAKIAAAEQMQPGHTEVIEYEDENGRWHVETAPDKDRRERHTLSRRAHFVRAVTARGRSRPICFREFRRPR
jgi:predicted SAM-dependent methyltransferase